LDYGNKSGDETTAKTVVAEDQGSRSLTDNYVIIGPLAETDLSTVEIIRETETGGHLLAKSLKDASPEVQERFHAAILNHGALQHPNIVQTVDWRVSDSGDPVFITEFLEGVNLEQLIDEVGTLEDDEEITSFLVQVCDALEYAHSQGIIHGGLKPSNIVITQPDETVLVKIADFGAINTSRELPEQPERTLSPYLSPEQRTGVATEKSDVFSVAAVAYQLITGYIPFQTIEDGLVLDEAASALSPISDYRPDIPEAELLGNVLAQALQWDPENRTPSVREFKKGVREWYQTIGEYEEDEDASGEYEAESDEYEGVEESAEEEAFEEEEQQQEEQEEQTYEEDLEEAPAAYEEQEPVEEQPEEVDESEQAEAETEQAETEQSIEVEAHASAPAEEDAPVSAIGIIRKADETVLKRYGDEDDEYGDIDDLDDLDDLDDDEAEPAPQAAPTAPASDEKAKTTGFGSDIADAEFDIDDGAAPDAVDLVTPPAEPQAPPPSVGNTPEFSAPPGTPPQAAAREPATPSDQELSGRYSRVARLPAMQAIPGMEASLAAPPKKEVQELSDHEKEREQIKKFKKHKKTKRNKSKINSTMTKLMALRTNQVEQSLTVSTKISETFAQDGVKLSPRAVILRVVASIIIFGVSAILVVANLDVLKSIWLVASRNVSAMLGKKDLHQELMEDTQIDATTAQTAKNPAAKDDPTKGGQIAASNGQQGVNPNATVPINQKYKTNLMPVHHAVDRRTVMPKYSKPVPGQKRYTGAVYPILFTEEEVHRDPKAPRPTDSERKEIPGEP